MKLSKSLSIVLLIQVTEVLGFSLILPFLCTGFKGKFFGGGFNIESVFLFQFVSAPLLGRLAYFV